jgi:hypothetical protein
VTLDSVITVIKFCKQLGCCLQNFLIREFERLELGEDLPSRSLRSPVTAPVTLTSCPLILAKGGHDLIEQRFVD